MKKLILGLSFLLFIPLSHAGFEGCCSYHGGISHCSRDNRLICEDYKESPTCTCNYLSQWDLFKAEERKYEELVGQHIADYSRDINKQKREKIAYMKHTGRYVTDASGKLLSTAVALDNHIKSYYIRKKLKYMYYLQ